MHAYAKHHPMPVGGRVIMVFRGIPGRSYTIQRSTDMAIWIDLATVAAGTDALFLEVHPTPERALSDGPNALRIDDLEHLLRVCLRIREALTVSDLPGLLRTD